MSRTVSFPSAAIGLTGAISALISAFVLPEVRLRPPETGSKFCAARRGGRYDDRRQVEVQLVAPPFVLRRQLKRRAQRLWRLVYGEPRLVGCNLEKNAARLPVVDRAEILAVDHRRDLTPGPDQRLAPGKLRLSSVALQATWWTVPAASSPRAPSGASSTSTSAPGFPSPVS